MNRIIKRGLIIGIIGAVAYQSFRLFRLAMAAKKMEAALKEHLNSLFGEEPKLSCSISASPVISINLIAKFSSETLAKHTDIEETVKSFIAEKYPILIINRFKVIVCDKNMSTLDLIKQSQPKIFKQFGKLIERKLKAADCCKEADTEEIENTDKPIE
jgi:hypothetical protein